jgi:hypothetical protein
MVLPVLLYEFSFGVDHQPFEVRCLDHVVLPLARTQAMASCAGRVPFSSASFSNADLTVEEVDATGRVIGRLSGLLRQPQFFERPCGQQPFGQGAEFFG